MDKPILLGSLLPEYKHQVVKATEKCPACGKPGVAGEGGRRGCKSDNLVWRPGTVCLLSIPPASREASQQTETAQAQ